MFIWNIYKFQSLLNCMFTVLDNTSNFLMIKGDFCVGFDYCVSASDGVKRVSARTEGMLNLGCPCWFAFASFRLSQ